MDFMSNQFFARSGFAQASERRHTQRIASSPRVQSPKSSPRLRNGFGFGRSSVQAARLVGKIRAAQAGGAQITLFDQSNLATHHAWPFHPALDEFVQEVSQGLFVRNLQQYLGGETGIEPTFAFLLHNRNQCPVLPGLREDDTWALTPDHSESLSDQPPPRAL